MKKDGNVIYVDFEYNAAVRELKNKYSGLNMSLDDMVAAETEFNYPTFDWDFRL